MIALLALLFTFHQASAILNTTIIPEGVPILYNRLANAHISFDTYRVIYAVNLTDYYRIEKRMWTAISEMKNRCPTDATSIRTTYCKATVLQLEKRLQETNYDDENLAGYREKRFCHWCGDFLHYSTGVVDSDTAKIWTEHMNAIQNETSIQNREIFNQTAIFKTFMEANVKTTDNTEKTLNRLRISLNELSSHTEEQIAFIQNRMIDQEIFQLADMALTEHERIYNKLRSIMVNTKRGRIPELIRRDRLTRQLKEIAAILPASQRLPININEENPLHIFKFADVSAMLFDSHLLMTIMLPIAESEFYGLYKTTAIPVLNEGRRYIAKITTDHFLLNQDHTKFIPLNRDDMKNARTRTPREMLYRPTASIITNPEIICEWKIFSELNIKSAIKVCEFSPLLTHEMVIAVLNNEQYFISTAGGLKVREICENQTSKYTIQDRSLIKIDPRCSFSTGNFELRAHKVRTVNSTDTLVPDYTAAEMLSKRVPQLTTSSYTKLIVNMSTPIIIHDAGEMNEMIKRTESLLKFEDHEFKLNDLEYDATGWSLGLLIAIATLAVALAIGTFLACRRFTVMSVAVKTVGNATQQLPTMIQSLTPSIIQDFLVNAPIFPNLLPVNALNAPMTAPASRINAV